MDHIRKKDTLFELEYQEGKTIGYYEYDLTADCRIDNSGDLLPEFLHPLKQYTETIPYAAEHYVYKEDRERFYWFFSRNRLLAQFHDNKLEAKID